MADEQANVFGGTSESPRHGFVPRNMLNRNKRPSPRRQAAEVASGAEKPRQGRWCGVGGCGARAARTSPVGNSVGAGEARFSFVVAPPVGTEDVVRLQMQGERMRRGAGKLRGAKRRMRGSEVAHVLAL